MRRFLAAVPLAAPALCAGLSAGDTPPDPYAGSRAAQKAILELADNLDEPDVRERAAKLVREHESDSISSIFRLSRRGGLGVGPLAPTPTQDGIERLLIVWRNKPPTAEVLKEHQKDALRIARAVRAMSELAPHRVPKNARPNVAKEWADVSKEFHAGALGLHRAVESGDPITVRDASRKLFNTCCHCHSLLD